MFPKTAGKKIILKKYFKMKSKADITLVNVVFPTRINNQTFRYVPVGILSLASFLQTKNIKANILDTQLENNMGSHPSDFYEFFNRIDTPILGVGVMAKDLPPVLIALERLKNSKPDMIIILGGPGPTGSAVKIIEKFSFIDFIITGEGEITLAELLKELDKTGKKDFNKINGLVFSHEGKAIANPARPRIENLDSLPRPGYSLIDKSKYNYIYLPGARGCSHFCTFCDQPALWQGKEIKRSLKNLFEEIEYLKNNLKADWGLAFSDNEFCADPRRFQEFIKLMKEKQLKFPFSMDRRIDAVDKNTLKEARLAGCRQVLYGIESGSNKVLKEIRKDFQAELIKPGLLLSAQYIENSIASFMFNYPFETLRDFLKTINLIYQVLKKNTPNYITIQLHQLAPLPRTVIFARYKNELIRKGNWNLLTSNNNMQGYDYYVDEKNKKNLVTPKTGNQSFQPENEIQELIDENPEIFPSFYFYNSPDYELKEKLIEKLRVSLTSKMNNLLFRINKYLIYIGKNDITVAGPADQKNIPGALIILNNKMLDAQEETLTRINQLKKQVYLVSVKTEDITGEPESGKKILNFLLKLKKESEKIILLSAIPRQFFSFSDYFKIKDIFKMPEKEEDSGDIFIVGDNGDLWSNKGRLLGNINGFKDKKQVLSAINLNLK
ncbi:MAG: B12-binding domain-containing radical SAM protein [Vulcanimicrobiota bacterium]